MTYNIVLNVTRDSTDAALVAACRTASRCAHPDHGGSTAHQQELNDARAAWDTARAAKNKRPQQRVPAHAEQRHPGDSEGQAAQQGRGHAAPAASVAAPAALHGPERARRRIHSEYVLLTYQGLEDIIAWRRLLVFIRTHLTPWKVKHWCCTLEANADHGHHAHAMLQFRSTIDRTISAFVFEGVAPNASTLDICGQGLCKKQPQVSMNRGFFYCWANKIGTVLCEDGSPCVDGNYSPCWTSGRFTYQVLGSWPETLWKQRKLTTEVYTEYLYLTRDGVPGRKRNLEEVTQHEEEHALALEVAATVKRVRSNPALNPPFPVYPAVVVWKQLFERDAMRYPVLIVLGPSLSGKTEFAHSLFKNALELKVGALTYMPDKLRLFNRRTHDGIIFDDLRDLTWLTDHQDKIQGKYNAILEFGSSPGGQCAYYKYLFKVPMVATCNFSTQSLGLLETHDWLGKPANRVLVHFDVAAEHATSTDP